MTEECYVGGGLGDELEIGGKRTAKAREKLNLIELIFESDGDLDAL